MQCLSCEHENSSSSKFCSLCGLPLPPEKPTDPSSGIICSVCQHINLADSYFCYYCGHYFLEMSEQPPADNDKQSDYTEKEPPLKARILIPGRPDLVLSGEPIFIERSSFDQTLPHDVLMSISRQHILITFDRGTYYVQDFGREGKGSTNHTRLNDADIYQKGRQPLQDGDRIELARQSELALTFKLT